MNGLSVRNLSMRYGDLEVLHEISLDVAPGEIAAVIGANGAGKTSLLKTVAGVLRPAAGEITAFGERIGGRSSWNVVAHGIVLVPEGRGIFGDQSVRDNLMLGAVGRRTFDQLDLVLARFPHLGSRLDHQAGTLSGGQQQMLALARGMMARPRVLLLDEPSLGLAPKLLRETFEMIKRIRDDGVGVLLVEQMARVALEIADRGYVLERGRIAAQGLASALARDERVITAYLGRRGAPRVPLSIRRLQPHERALLKELRLRALGESPAAFAHTLAETTARPEAYWDGLVASMTPPRYQAMFVVERLGMPIGFCFALLDANDSSAGHLGGMWIDPVARGAGAGRALVDAVIAWAHERGFARIDLWVTDGNAPATTLYERTGFTRTGRLRPHPTDPALQIAEMTRPL